MEARSFPREALIGILKEHKSGVAVAEPYRNHGVSAVSIYK